MCAPFTSNSRQAICWPASFPTAKALGIRRKITFSPMMILIYMRLKIKYKNNLYYNNYLSRYKLKRYYQSLIRYISGTFFTIRYTKVLTFYMTICFTSLTTNTSLFFYSFSTNATKFSLKMNNISPTMRNRVLQNKEQ